MASSKSFPVGSILYGHAANGGEISGSSTQIQASRTDTVLGGYGYTQDNAYFCCSHPVNYNTNKYLYYSIRIIPSNNGNFLGIGKGTTLDDTVKQVGKVKYVTMMGGPGKPLYYVKKFAIEDNASLFRDCTGLEYCAFAECAFGVNIPDELRELYSEGAHNITSLAMVQNIGNGAFQGLKTFKGCLTALIGPSLAKHPAITGIRSGAIAVNRIGDDAFNGCSALDDRCSYIMTTMNYTGDEGQVRNSTHIGSRAFKDCANFDPYEGFTLGIPSWRMHVEVPVTFGDYVFENTAAVGNFPFIDKSITTLPKGCFARCKNIREVNTYHQYYITSNDYATRTTGITTLGAEAYIECPNLSQVSLDPKITRIENKVFYKCAALREVFLNDGLTYIGQHAFDGTKIYEIDIPSTVESIDRDAFANCPNLQRVIFQANYPSTITDAELEERLNSTDKTKKINPLYLGQGVFYNSGTNANKILTIKTIYSDGVTIEELPKHTRALGKGAFNRSGIKNFKANMKQLQYVGHSLFKDCANLNSVTFYGQIDYGTENDGHSKLISFEDANCTKVTLLIKDTPECTKLANRCLFSGCAALKYYQGPPDFLFGHTYDPSTNDGYTYWESASALENVVLTSCTLFQKDTSTKYIDRSIDLNSHGDGFLAKMNPKLKHIYFPRGIIVISPYVPFGNKTTSRYPELRVIAALDRSNLTRIVHQYPTAVDIPYMEQITFFLRTLRDIGEPAYLTEDYTFFDNRVHFYETIIHKNEKGEVVKEEHVFNDQYRLSDSFYRRVFNIHCDNVLLWIVKMNHTLTDKIKRLFYTGKKIWHEYDPEMPFSKIQYLHLDDEVEIIGANSFRSCTELQSIYTTFYDKTIEKVLKPHHFRYLTFVCNNSFPAPNTENIQDFYRCDLNTLGYYMATTERNILMHYRYSSILTGSLDFSNVSVLAKSCFKFPVKRKDSAMQYLTLPFIGNIHHTKEVSDLTFNFTTVADLVDKPQNVEKLKLYNPGGIILQGDNQQATFGTMRLTHLKIVAPIDIKGILFTKDSFAENASLIFGELNSDIIVRNVPSKFIQQEHINNPEDKISLSLIDCRYMNCYDDFTIHCTFYPRCFESVTNQNLIFILPKAFKGFALADDPWFDFSNNNITFKELRYPDSLENFVSCGYQESPFRVNTFGHNKWVPFPYVEVFKTIENADDGIYDIAPTLLEFSTNIQAPVKKSITIPNGLLYNNKFLNSINLDTVTYIEREALGAEQEGALIEILNCTEELYKNLDINIKRVINGLSSVGDTQMATSQIVMGLEDEKDI